MKLKLFPLAALLPALALMSCGNPVSGDPDLLLIKSIAASIPDEITLDPTATGAGTRVTSRAIGELPQGEGFSFANIAPDMAAIMQIISDCIGWVKADIRNSTMDVSGVLQNIDVPIEVKVIEETGEFVTLQSVKYDLQNSTLIVWLGFHLNYYDAYIVDFKIKVEADQSGFLATLAMWEDGVVGALDESGANRYWRITEDYASGEASMVEFVREDEVGPEDFAYMTWHAKTSNSEGKMDYGSFLINEDPMSMDTGTILLNRDLLYLSDRYDGGTLAIALYEEDKSFIGAVENPDTFDYDGFTYSTSTYNTKWPTDYDDFYDDLTSEAESKRAAGQSLIDAGEFFIHSEFEGF